MSPPDELEPCDWSRPGTGLTLARGRTLDWHAAGYGEYVTDVSHAFASREIDAIAGAGEMNIQGAQSLWEHMRGTAFRVLAGAAFMPGCDALELRYVATPRVGQPTRLRMFVTAKALETSVATVESAVEAACVALPAEFTWIVPGDGPAFGAARGWGGDTIVELRRLEEITMPQWNFIPTEFYYSINDDPGDGSGWPAFWNAFARITQPVEISIVFCGTEIDAIERNVLGRITTELAMYGNPRTDYDVFGNQVQYPADTNAAAALASWQRRIEQLQRPLLSRVSVRAEPESAYAVATALASAIGASTAGTNVSQPMYVDSPGVDTPEERLAFEAFDWMEILPWGGIQLWEAAQAPRPLRRLPYLYGLNEAAGLAVLPVPDEQGVPGFERARRNVGRRAAIRASTLQGPSVQLGDVLHQGQPAGQIRLPLSAVLRHTLIVGASGSGKTTTVHSLIAELWREHRVPFLAIEPIKTEYRALLETPGMDDLQVMALGRDDISPMRLNPLQPPPGVRCETHASAVMSSLKLAMPLFTPLPQLLEAALEHAYGVAGWDYDTTPEEGIRPPTLRTLLSSFDIVFDRVGYVGEARDMSAALRVRLKSLLQGSRGRVFDTVESMDFARLMQRPLVLELDALGDSEDKSIIAAFILERVRAAARARSSTGGELKHVTVIEEAHRLLARADEGHRDTVSGDNTRSSAVRAFCEAIRELRAQGEGFILSSQRPADLAMAAVATTSTRILHRVETAIDRKDILDDLDASELDREAAARLRAGEAIVRWADQDDAELVQVRAADGVDTGRAVDDGVVARHMAEVTAVTRGLLPFTLCTRDVCPKGCQPSIRSEGKLIATDCAPEAVHHWKAHEAAADALGPIAKMLAREADGNLQLAYCGAAHINAEGNALVLTRRRDIRPLVARAIQAAVSEP